MRSPRTRGLSVWSGLSLAVLGLLALLLVLIRVYPYPYAFPVLPQITHTASGPAGDPINLVFVGSQQQITESFQQAAWLVPDPITPATSAAIIPPALRIARTRQRPSAICTSSGVPRTSPSKSPPTMSPIAGTSGSGRPPPASAANRSGWHRPPMTTASS